MRYVTGPQCASSGVRALLRYFGMTINGKVQTGDSVNVKTLAEYPLVYWMPDLQTKNLQTVCPNVARSHASRKCNTDTFIIINKWIVLLCIPGGFMFGSTAKIDTETLWCMIATLQSLKCCHRMMHCQTHRSQICSQLLQAALDCCQL